ncbi:hypothetical protein GQX73_g1778 [Xylaria multiplex]|uniref:AB hydrolase-1 domain-containing protein n=1 Tax=Xylaria multiplex TaxID=323545 RepID=A0A7C8N2Q2_9PEZI|nr:hypothetical protein GQX73_g1778 [Xylaria multiplex]
MMGFGGTVSNAEMPTKAYPILEIMMSSRYVNMYSSQDAPKVPPAPLNVYGWKQAADNIAELAKQLGCKTIVLGGHDWGGPVVYRTCLWHPTLVSHVFSVCTPYKPSAEQFVPLPTLVAGLVPQFGYQLQFAGQDVEAAVQSEGDIRRLLSAIYGGPTPDGECIFDPRKGVDIAKLPSVGEAPLLKGEDLDYYTREFSRNGVRGGLNWYRTYQANWEDEVGLEKKTIDIPCLFVLASRDTVLTKDLSEGMEDFIPLLTRKEIDAGHFVLVEKPHEVNIALQEWLEQYGI